MMTKMQNLRAGNIVPATRSQLKTLLLVFGIASCLVLLTATQRTVIGLTDRSVTASGWGSFLPDLTHWYLWAAAVFPIYWIVRRNSIQNLSPARAVILHLPLGFLFAFGNILIQAFLLSLVLDGTFLSHLQRYFYVKLFMRTAFYFVIVIGCTVFVAHQRRKEEEVKARNLETRLALIQFQVLKSKLNPEFLFRTLQSISLLMRKDIEAADRLTARLGDFLRLSLENSCVERVPLQDELELVKSYVEIQRFSSPELQLGIQIDPHVIAMPVPNRVLFDAVQSCSPQRHFDISAFVRNNHMTLAISGIDSRNTGKVAEWSRPFQWIVENGQVKMNVPLQPEEGPEEPLNETFSESLEDSHRSVAKKEEHVQSSKPSSGRRFWGTLAVWTFAGLFFSASEILTRSASGEPLRVLETLGESLMWYWWAILTPVVFLLARTFPLRSGYLKKSIPVHLAFSFAISFAMVLLYLGQRWIFQQETNAAVLQETLLRYPYVFDALTYWAIVGVYEGLNQRWKYLQEEVRTSKLKGHLLEAQVQALKMQLHPHFLFNTLNSISELMHEDLDAADRMLKRLENFLRLTFENTDVQETTLQNELIFLKNYLEIQQVRFQNRLKVDLQIDPQAMKDHVPNLILQPIVENAIRHGVSPRVDSGRVEIRAFHREGNLHLEVEDDGPGLRGGSFREGVGMSNTRRRLEQIYGKACRFGVKNNPHGGLIVTLQIPATLRNA
jgi:two-component system, LytTR family, sensor kinase